MHRCRTFRFHLFFLSAGLLSALPILAQSKTHHVVFVISSPDPADWGTAMTLADHFIAGVAPDRTDVEVLAYGPGIESLKAGAPEAPELTALEKQGVHFVACESAMHAFHIAKTDLLPGVTSVPSGVVELVTRQEKGYSYVKVGR